MSRFSNRMLYTGIKDVCMNLADVTDAIERSSKADIEARDRVNISLGEYERMKDDIRNLQYLVRDYEAFLEKIRYPFGEKVIPETVKTWYTNRDPISLNPLAPNRMRIRIEFEIEREGI